MTTELVRLEKRMSVIQKLKQEHGFCLYFFFHCKKMSLSISCQLDQWKLLTKGSEQFRWTLLNPLSIGFLLDEKDQLYFNVTENQFQSRSEYYPTENRDICQSIMEDGFDHFFIHFYCIDIRIDTMTHWISITKEDWKSSWIVDKMKNVIFFKFRNLCGEGSVKKTYLGWNVTKNVPVVVYQIHVPPNQNEQKRYANEKRIAQVQRSPFLLSIHYWFTHRESQKVFMIADFMKYSVKTMIDINYPWSLQEFKLFSFHVLTALEVLHRMKIIHRDVKPSNILYDDEKNFYCLIDFGVATKYNITANRVETINIQTDHLSLVGTVGYIAPEMYKSIYNLLDDPSYTFAVDIFAMGITLLEMLTKKRAFENDLSTLSQIIPSNLMHHSESFQKIIHHELSYLQDVSSQMTFHDGSNKMIKKLRQDLDSKIQLLDQLLVCEAEEKESYISELLDKNRSISLCCKRFKSDSHLSELEKQTSMGHTFISEMQGLELFASKLDMFSKRPMDEILMDLSVYPILFNSPHYEYPSSLQDIPIPLLQDFLKQCLHKDPTQRWTASQLLQHPWLTEDDRY